MAQSKPAVKANGADHNGQGNGTLARAVALHLEGKPNEALAEIERGAAAGEDGPDLLAAKAQIEYELELFDRAGSSYDKLLRAKPGHPTARFNAAVCLEKLARWKEAATHFQAELEANPGRTEARRVRAICQLHSEQPQNARESFERVLAQKPDHATAQFGRAVALQLEWRF